MNILQTILVSMSVMIFGLSVSYAQSTGAKKEVVSPVPEKFECTQDALEENPYIVKGGAAPVFMKDGICTDEGELKVNACFIEIKRPTWWAGLLTETFTSLSSFPS